MKVQNQNSFSYTGRPTLKITKTVQKRFHLSPDETLKTAVKSGTRKTDFNESCAEFLNYMNLLEKNIRKNPWNMKENLSLAGKALRAGFRANVAFLRKS